MNPNWKPDPRWPRHILELAFRITEGVDCREQLHDALLDEGLPLFANQVMGEGRLSMGMMGQSHMTCGYATGLIVGDGWRSKSPDAVEKEMEAYLNRRGTA